MFPTVGTDIFPWTTRNQNKVAFTLVLSSLLPGDQRPLALAGALLQQRMLEHNILQLVFNHSVLFLFFLDTFWLVFHFDKQLRGLGLCETRPFLAAGVAGKNASLCHCATERVLLDAFGGWHSAADDAAWNDSNLCQGWEKPSEMHVVGQFKINQLCFWHLIQDSAEASAQLAARFSPWFPFFFSFNLGQWIQGSACSDSAAEILLL